MTVEQYRLHSHSLGDVDNLPLPILGVRLAKFHKLMAARAKGR